MKKERPTKTLKLEIANAEVTLFAYITGADKRAIESIYMNEAEIVQKIGGDRKGEAEIAGIKGSVNHLMQDAALKAVVKEIHDLDEDKVITNKSEIISYLLDLPEEEYNTVLENVNEITEPKKS